MPGFPLLGSLQVAAAVTQGAGMKAGERGEREAKHIGNRWREKGEVNGRTEERKRRLMKFQKS